MNETQKRSSKTECSKRERVNRPFFFRSLLIKAHQQLSWEQKILADDNKRNFTKHFIARKQNAKNKAFSGRNFIYTWQSKCFVIGNKTFSVNYLNKSYCCSYLRCFWSLRTFSFVPFCNKRSGAFECRPNLFFSVCIQMKFFG